jgi:hypothetical protein
MIATNYILIVLNTDIAPFPFIPFQNQQKMKFLIGQKNPPIAMGNFFGSSDKNSTINLSQDVLSNVMSFLTAKEIVQVSLTSKQFNSCSNEQTIWRQNLKTLLSTKYSPPKDLNWKQEYINKRFLFNSTTKVNPEFCNEISRQINKHNGRIIPGVEEDSYIQYHVNAKKFSCLTYYSRDISGFDDDDDDDDMFFIEYQNKLYRLFENFTGVVYKKLTRWNPRLTDNTPCKWKIMEKLLKRLTLNQ